MNLRGTFTKNRYHNDSRAPHNDSRAPQDIQGTLRKSRSQVPRPPRADGHRQRETSQRSPTGHKGHRNECQDAQRAIGDRGMLNSAPNVQIGQNRLSRRRVARTFVHTTHGFGTFGSAHGHLDLPLRSPTNSVSHRAVAGTSVPTRFPETGGRGKRRDNLPLPTSLTYNLASIPTLAFPYTLRALPLPTSFGLALYCFPDFVSTDFVSALLLSGLRVRFTAFRTRVHGLRVRFTAFRTSRPLYCFPDFAFTDFASTDFAFALLLSGLRVRFTVFRTSHPFYCFPDFASALLLSGLRFRFTAFWTSRPVYCFLDFASTDFASPLLLFGLRVHGLRVRFTAFWTLRPRISRPLYCFLDFASTDFASTDFAPGLLLSGLRVHGLRARFTDFWTSRPLYRFPDFASTFTAFRTSRGVSYHGERRQKRSPGPIKGASLDLWLHPLTEHATKEGQANHRSTERCPIRDSKNPSQCQSDQRHVRGHFRGIPHKPGHPDLSRTPFLTRLPGPATLTSKRPPKTGLQALRDHRGHGTSFRRPFGTLQSSPRDVSVIPHLRPPSSHSSRRKNRVPWVIRAHTGPLRVPFRPTTSASRAITFKGFLTTLSLPREEVVTVRGPINHAQPPFHHYSLTGFFVSIPNFFSLFWVCLGFGTFGSTHGHLDLPLRSPTNPVSHRAVAGTSVPTRFPRDCRHCASFGSFHP
ncbi:hypothetical protein CRG98_037830 [Punica granatum]|uniref:Uncharacterized protein n=1 Tax=Punica granatum TaxID=22663 RepID=A0A2I0ICQ7_PUNGR|nr:hypothetical protein CRG98_037830 [Punica granatum]